METQIQVIKEKLKAKVDDKKMLTKEIKSLQRNVGENAGRKDAATTVLRLSEELMTRARQCKVGLGEHFADNLDKALGTANQIIEKLKHFPVKRLNPEDRGTIMNSLHDADDMSAFFREESHNILETYVDGAYCQDEEFCEDHAHENDRLYDDLLAQCDSLEEAAESIKTILSVI